MVNCALEEATKGFYLLKLHLLIFLSVMHYNPVIVKTARRGHFSVVLISNPACSFVLQRATKKGDDIQNSAVSNMPQRRGLVLCLF
jgi:hypothetical protein